MVFAFGKYLAATETEIVVEFKPPPQRLFEDSAAGGGPDIALAVRVKLAGNDFVGIQKELYLLEEQPGAETPYERLLGDAMMGDGALFAREDAVEAAWTVVDPILRTHDPVRPYKRHSWGPKEADALIALSGPWQNPEVRNTAD